MTSKNSFVELSYSNCIFVILVRIELESALIVFLLVRIEL